MTNEQLLKLTKDVLVANLEVLSKDESLDGCTLQEIAAGLTSGICSTIVAISDEKVSKLEATELVIDLASRARKSMQREEMKQKMQQKQEGKK